MFALGLRAERIFNDKTLKLYQLLMRQVDVGKQSMLETIDVLSAAYALCHRTLYYMYSFGIQKQMETEANDARERVKLEEVEGTKSDTEVEVKCIQNEVDKMEEEINKSADNQEHEDKEEEGDGNDDDNDKDDDDDNNDDDDEDNDDDDVDDDHNDDDDDNDRNIKRDNVREDNEDNEDNKDTDNFKNGESHKYAHINEELREVDANVTPIATEVEEAKTPQQSHREKSRSNFKMEKKEEKSVRHHGKQCFCCGKNGHIKNTCTRRMLACTHCHRKRHTKDT